MEKICRDYVTSLYQTIITSTEDYMIDNLTEIVADHKSHLTERLLNLMRLYSAKLSQIEQVTLTVQGPDTVLQAHGAKETTSFILTPLGASTSVSYARIDDEFLSPFTVGVLSFYTKLNHQLTTHDTNTNSSPQRIAELLVFLDFAYSAYIADDPLTWWLFAHLDGSKRLDLFPSLATTLSM